VARYADRLLADGEQVRLRGRQHVLATILEGRIPWLIFVASVVLLFLSPAVAIPEARTLVSWFALVLLLVGLAWLTQIYLSWYAQDYVVTNRRVMKVEGILKKRSADSSLEKINDAVLEQSVLGRMMGYGDLDILTANEQSVDRLRMLAGAQQFKRTMLDEKHKLEQDVFQIPAPPLRAPAPMSTPAATSPVDPTPAALPPAPAAPVERAPREMSSEQITDALGDLADLRDRGAISPEEYEAKKQDLLARL
jgi:hypothetical protein